MPRRNTLRKNGGALKGQGSGGCTFIPSIRCADEKERRVGTISKLMLPDEGLREMQQQTMLKSLDPQQKYFLWPVHICEPTYDPAENNTSGCLLGKPNIKQHDPKIVLFTNGGENLEKIDAVVKNNIDVGEFFVGLLNIFEGLVKLHNADIAHLDIKTENIVGLKSETGKFNIRFIDFGLTQRAASVESEKNNRIYSANYFAWPYELRLIYPQYKDSIDEPTDIANFYAGNVLNFNVPNVPVWQWYDTDGRTPLLMTPIGAQILERTKNATKKDLIKAADIYSLGRLLATMYSKYSGHINTGQGKIKQTWVTDNGEVLKNTISIPFYQLINQMMAVDMTMRPTAEQAMGQYKQILQKFIKFSGMLPISALLSSAIAPSSATVLDIAPSPKVPLSATVLNIGPEIPYTLQPSWDASPR